MEELEGIHKHVTNKLFIGAKISMDLIVLY